jgi:predicted  nucleic acid-binding Zn-ribbon protein
VLGILPQKNSLNEDHTMAKVTENEISQLNQRFDQVMSSLAQINLKLTDLEKNQIKLEGKLEKVESQLEGKLEKVKNQLEGSFNTVNTRLDAYKPALDKIPDLAEKVGELKGWRALSLVIFSGFITSLYWLFRMGKL